MIGIGYSINNRYSQRTIIANNLSNNEQTNIINQMITYIKEICLINNVNHPNTNLYHWSNFEPNILCRICNKLNIVNPVFRWTDILTLFHTEPIVIKGALDFSLKSIGKAMYKLKMIKTIWPSRSNISDGLDAMYEAYKIYKSNNNIVKKMKQIIIYNEIDCKIMWDILNAINKIA
jgi:predicted RecB family nuclease